MKGAFKRVFGSENVKKDCSFDHSFLDSQIMQGSVRYTQQTSKQKKERFSPLIKQGVVSRCTICDPIMHWAEDCQHKRSETANIAELNDEIEGNPENIIEEANIASMTTADTKIQTADTNKQNYRHCLYKNHCRRGMTTQLFKKS